MTEVAGALEVLRRELLAVHPGCQVFVFGPEGDPFWASHRPVSPDSLGLLDAALRLIEQLEGSRPRPFTASDPSRGLLVGALDEAHDLYFVVLLGTLEPKSAEARVAAVRAFLVPYANSLREQLLRRRIA